MIETTHYYDEFIRYYWLAKDQQEKCNLGSVPYTESNMGDDLMEHVELYDVVERKYAGFSQIINDSFYGWTDKHPYWPKMIQGHHTHQRKSVATNWTGKHKVFNLSEWLYIFILHRVTGSGINYSKKPSGYNNTIITELHRCDSIEEMVSFLNQHQQTFYTSVGYQFPSFPKVPAGKHYRKAGDYYLSEFAPKLARDTAEWLESGPKRDLREIGEFMLSWNTRHNLKQYKFQYAAIVADIADWYPQYVNKDSLFYYGSNAIECISYLAKPTTKMLQEKFLDQVMIKIYEDTGSVPYNAEDVTCDFIRWIENYVRPGSDYDHLDRDKIFSSCKIKDHPYGRQKAMLDLNLIDSFNNIDVHPSDDYVLKRASITVDEYKLKVKELNFVTQ